MHSSHAGLTSNDYSIDKLVSKHNVVSADVRAKNFDYRLANSLMLNADADVSAERATTYGTEYRYADIHHQPGSQFAEVQPVNPAGSMPNCITKLFLIISPF